MRLSRPGRGRVVGDRLQRHLIAAADLDVPPAAVRARGQHVAGLGVLPAGAAGQPGRNRNQVDGGAVRLGPGGHEHEGLGHGLGVDRVPDAEPDLDPGYLPAVGPLTHGVQHTLGQTVLVHEPPILPTRSGDNISRISRYRLISGIDSITSAITAAAIAAWISLATIARAPPSRVTPLTAVLAPGPSRPGCPAPSVPRAAAPARPARTGPCPG